MKRLGPQAGEWIDRSRPIGFTFEGRRYRGFSGDTLTSALLASGERTLGRSFKYHRRRGALSVANHDVNAVVQVRRVHGSVPNERADTLAIEEGLEAFAVNTQGGLERDGRAWLDRFSAFLPVGFYYKAFHSRRWFPYWERRIRDLAGLGSVDLKAPRRPTAKRYEFADVAVVGAGPSGLAAALAAAEAGADVVLADEHPHLGGSGTYALGSDPAAAQRVAEMKQAAGSHARIRRFTSTAAVGYYADHWLALDAPDRLLKLRARSVVFAQGAYEQPAVFRNNDLPGILLASGAQRLMRRYAVAPASRVAIVTANVHGYRAAIDARAAGIEVTAVLDLRERPGTQSHLLGEMLRAQGVRLLTGAAVYAAQADSKGCVAALELAEWRDGAWHPATSDPIAADGIWMSVGFAPADALLRQAGARLHYDARMNQFLPGALPPGLFACGKTNGIYDFDARLADGARAGAAAARHCGFETHRGHEAVGVPVEPASHPWPIVDHPKAKNFVDFDEDLQVKDLENAIQEGFDSAELMKRYTTVGMGPSQGKHSSLNALRVLARARGLALESLAPTTARPMFHPVPLSHLAGRGFTPERRTPMDGEHERLGAVWMPAGNWRRPEYYRRPDRSREECIAAEVKAVREGVALIDVGTLGKIEAHGAAAGPFLDRVYSGRFDTLKPGMTRYGLMLDESGVIIDDGVIARLAPEVFYFTTTTGNSATIFRELGRLATGWGMAVGLVNLTGQLAAFNLAGPRSRQVLAKLTSLDLADAAFPYLGVREAQVAGVPARLMRVGFVGELGYEIHIPASQGAGVWNAVRTAGAEPGIVPFGVEAQRMLRLEKGHIIVSQDTDGLTNPLEIGAGWAVKMDKPFFTGQRSLAIIAKGARRQQLVGFALEPGPAPAVKECHLVIRQGRIAGRVTSVGRSPTLGRTIGLALVAPAAAKDGVLHIRVDDHAMVHAPVVPTPFYDAAGSRQKSGASGGAA
ncbi:MAG TPA: glycine cleavage T C-terminal barrel domain-containing protein [Steroidobacteraceae bacterium]|nr:glycine cleavage T C-terminal barrel domain-containing protein [Steroidobacteraceae bacterium]